MTHLPEAASQGWDRIKARIGVLLSDLPREELRASAAAFVAAASSVPPPNEVGLGYWSNSVRLTWPTCEVEVFVGSFETYRFEPSGTRIETWPFRVGDTLHHDALAVLLP